MLFIDAAHESSGWRQDLINEDEDGLLWREFNPFANNVDELAHGEIGRNEVLLLVDGSDVALFNLLTNNLIETYG